MIKFLKDGTGILAKPVCNLSTSRGVFPNASKVAKLKLVFKKGKRSNLSTNYRPISLLPFIFKIIENVIHEQVNVYFSNENILFNYQSAFRVIHLTNLCLFFLTDKTLKGFDKGLLTAMLLIDLQKAFDAIDHEIFLQKPKAIRFSKGLDLKGYSGLDAVILSEYFLVILKVSSQI